MTSKKRNVKTYYLSNIGYQKLKDAIASEYPDGYTREKLEEKCTITNNHLNKDTISVILKREKKARKSSIQSLFNTFGLTLDNNDITHESPIIIDDKKYDPNFVGRENAIAHLKNLIQQGKKVIQIVASGGTGKTVLAQKYLNNHFETVLEFNIAKETKDIASVESLVEEKLRQLGEEPGREFMVSLDRLKQKLKKEKIGILIDNLEPALDENGMFINEHRSYVELLKVLTDNNLNSITFITSRERISEALDITLYNLPSLNISAWSEYWQHQNINTDIYIFTEIHKAFGGNALAMKVLCNPILNDYEGDIVAYWQDNKTEDGLLVEKAVANLIKEQFERLKKINLNAYNLLCRMGCYRYQDVPTVTEKGLNCLLWDVDKRKHKRVIKLLKERALVELKNGQYYLHPVIREEAIERSR